MRDKILIQNRIKINYFSNGYGPEPECPSLLVGIPSEALLGKFSDMLLKLADGDNCVLLLSMLDWILLDNISEVSFMNYLPEGGAAGAYKMSDARYSDLADNKSLYVYLSKTGWGVSIDMVKALRPGTHQYIDSMNLLVICSYMESRSH